MVGLSALSADRAVSVGGEHLGVDVCHVEDGTGQRKAPARKASRRCR